ncbi:unnamed protein product [Aphanomyces euteiches]|nr:hypothetical protein AeRB84_011701 [Aphanomyces euteiches]
MVAYKAAVRILAVAAIAERAVADQCSISKTTMTLKCGHVFSTADKSLVCPYTPSKCVAFRSGECFASDGRTAFMYEASGMVTISYRDTALKCPYDPKSCSNATTATYDSVFAKIDSDNRGDNDLANDTVSLGDVGKFCYNSSGVDTGYVVLTTASVSRYCIYDPKTCKAQAFTNAIKSVEVLNDIDRLTSSWSLNISELGPNFSVDAFNVTISSRPNIVFKDNRLTDISKTKFPSSVVFLDVTNNKLTSIGSLDNNAPSLITLQAANNMIASLDSAVFPASLTQLSLINNQIQKLNLSALPTALQSLYLNDNQISKLDGTTPPTLQNLWLDNNQLTAFDGSFLASKQANLTLKLRNNRISQIQGSFPSIQLLDLSSNRLSQFPTALGSMTVGTLNLAQNALTWSSSSSFPRGLTSLNMSGTAVQGSVLQASQLPTSLTALDLSNCSITNIDGSFPSSLASLRLDRNTMDTWTMSNDMFQFLAGLSDLTLPTPTSNFTCPQAATKKLNGTFSVCIKEIATMVTSAPVAAPTAHSSSATYVVVICGIVVAAALVLGYVFYRRRAAQAELACMTIETSKALQLEYKASQDSVQQDPVESPHMHSQDLETQMSEDMLARKSKPSALRVADRHALVGISLGDDLVQYRIPLNEVKILKPLTLDRSRSDVTLTSDSTQTVTQSTTSAFFRNKVMLYKAQFNERIVVLKTLTTDGSSITPEAEAFVRSIRLRATLEHPTIVGFVGVVWSTNVKKGMVGYGVLMEHLAHGDLARVLAFDATKAPQERFLQWQPRNSSLRPKLALLMDIASAIVYLHSFSPALIHRNIQSKNVLLGEKWEAKLTGVSADPSRDSSELVTAPEVLRGEPWTEKADIYAFGILLCEVDLGHHPYLNKKDPESSRQMATLVMADLLQPTFTPDCPPQVQDIAKKCLAFDRKERPTAVQMEFWLRKAMQSMHGDM